MAGTDQPAAIEHLGQPCRAKNVLATRLVVDRADGRERFVLTNMNEDTGCELIFIDYEKDTGRVVRAPAGSGSWALNEVPGDRLIVGTAYDGAFMVFDLKKMEFVKVAKFPGESYIWNLAMGGDGRIYGGTYGGGKLGAFDLTTYEVEDCGAPAPPNMYLRDVSALPDGRILCNLGMKKPQTLIYDPASKKFSPPPDSIKGVTKATVWNGLFIAGSQVYDGKTLQPITPPFPVPPADKGEWSVLENATTNDVLYLCQGDAFYRYKAGGKSLDLIGQTDAQHGDVSAVTSKGELLGVRGQDYFVIRPGDSKIKLRPIPVESGPRPTLFLRADERGILWGGPRYGQTLFWLDPRTKKYVNTGRICDKSGEVYDSTFVGGKVYSVAYSGGDIICYDPAKPWNQIDHINPRVIASVKPKGYIRPIGGVHVGPDGKLYSGWMAKYGTYGGAVAITDPATGATDLIENPLGEQAVAGVVPGAGVVYVGTSLRANGRAHKKGESPRFGIVDLATRKAVFQQEFEGAGNCRPLCYDGATKRVAFSVDGAIRFFDTVKNRVLVGRPVDAPRLSCASIAFPGDGKLYYGSDNSVIALNMRTGNAIKLAEAPANVSNVAVGPDGTVYFSCGVDIYRVKK